MLRDRKEGKNCEGREKVEVTYSMRDGVAGTIEERRGNYEKKCRDGLCRMRLPKTNTCLLREHGNVQWNGDIYETSFGGKNTMIRCNIIMKSVRGGGVGEDTNTHSFSWSCNWEVAVLNAMRKTHATMETQ